MLGHKSLTSYVGILASLCAVTYVPLNPKIVDDELRLVSPGVVGELCVAGSQTFPGYWRDPAQAARFFNHTDPGGRAQSYYRTGDLVKCLDGGHLAFMGRVDHQIKVRGYRIDPGDIEAVLARQGGVDQAVAFGWPLESENAQGIVAFVAGSLEDPTSLYDALRQEVPTYMIPNKIHVIPSMPLNSNGKVDRNALRARWGWRYDVLRRPLVESGRVQRDPYLETG